MGLPFSPLCDREKTPLAESQIGFINFIVEPSFVLLGDMIDKIFEQILAEDKKSQSVLSDDLNNKKAA
jgi:calcium/calmodulin-dependent 3',5'-cyclic nucleotide phosphodiesterase